MLSTRANLYMRLYNLKQRLVLTSRAATEASNTATKDIWTHNGSVYQNLFHSSNILTIMHTGQLPRTRWLLVGESSRNMWQRSRLFRGSAGLSAARYWRSCCPNYFRVLVRSGWWISIDTRRCYPYHLKNQHLLSSYKKILRSPKISTQSFITNKASLLLPTEEY